MRRLLSLLALGLLLLGAVSSCCPPDWRPVLGWFVWPQMMLRALLLLIQSPCLAFCVCNYGLRLIESSTAVRRCPFQPKRLSHMDGSTRTQRH